jgi:hypothetical protein
MEQRQSFPSLVFMLFEPIPTENRDIVNITLGVLGVLGVLGSTFCGIVAY